MIDEFRSRAISLYDIPGKAIGKDKVVDDRLRKVATAISKSSLFQVNSSDYLLLITCM